MSNILLNYFKPYFKFISHRKRISIALKALTIFSYILPYSNCYSQVNDTLYTFSVQKNLPAFHFGQCYIPSALIALGTYSNKEETIINNEAIKSARDEHLPHFQTHIDDYLQYAPLLAGYAFAAGSPGKLWPYTKEVLVNEIILCISVKYIKHWSKVPSVVNGSYNAFPSGHTAQAFSAATLFNDNFVRGRPWLQVLSYGSASTVGVLRILNNRHWTSDVIAGAGFGILSAKLSELIVNPRKTKKYSR
ncbi:MAG: phosphatase PAP2 family protein [Parafilimonas sp.]